MYVHVIPGDLGGLGLRSADGTVSQHLQRLKEGMENDRASLTTKEGAQESPRCQSHGFQEGCSASAPQFFQLGVLTQVRGMQ